MQKDARRLGLGEERLDRAAQAVLGGASKAASAARLKRVMRPASSQAMIINRASDQVLGEVLLSPQRPLQPRDAQLGGDARQEDRDVTGLPT
ncbi:hypothetical protein HS125_13735 [bacterium]|nr:hypothetical protein [bacterium]